MTVELLVLGAGGMVGREAARLCEERGRSAACLSRAEIDITDAARVAEALATHRPRVVANCAAYTKVDRAESEPDLAHAVNAAAAGDLARLCERNGAALIHLSTDYVFDGAKPSPYVESDPVAPLSVYGATKLEGEERVRSSCARHVILRTAWVYGVYGANFLKTVLRLAGERDQLRIVADQIGRPTGARDIAEAMLIVADAFRDRADATGLYHFAGQGEATWFDFAREIVAAQAPFTGRRPEVQAIATSDYPTPAKRPANSRLDCARFYDTFGYRAQPWRDRVSGVVGVLMRDGEPA